MIRTDHTAHSVGGDLQFWHNKDPFVIFCLKGLRHCPHELNSVVWTCQRSGISIRTMDALG